LCECCDLLTKKGDKATNTKCISHVRAVTNYELYNSKWITVVVSLSQCRLHGIKNDVIMLHNIQAVKHV